MGVEKLVDHRIALVRHARTDSDRRAGHRRARRLVQCGDAVRRPLLMLEAGQRHLGPTIHHAVDAPRVETLRPQHALGLHDLPARLLMAGRRDLLGGRGRAGGRC